MNIDKRACVISGGIVLMLLALMGLSERITSQYRISMTPLILYTAPQVSESVVSPPPVPEPEPQPVPKKEAVLPAKKQPPKPKPQEKTPSASVTAEKPAAPPPQPGTTAIQAESYEVIELFALPLDQFYPEAAWDAGKEALVVVKILVNTQGKVTSVEVIKGDDTYGFVTAAKAWLQTVKFQPIQKDGKKVPFYYVLPISFKLL